MEEVKPDFVKSGLDTITLTKTDLKKLRRGETVFVGRFSLRLEVTD